MRHKLLTTLSVVFFMLTAGCSTMSKVVYRPDINQGNYLTANDVGKLQKGMNKQQVAYLLGTPMMQDPFGSDTWIYIFRQQPGHEDPKQQTLKLHFNKEGILTDMQGDFPNATRSQAAPVTESGNNTQGK
ncbi:MAG: outer membrane protein assembly factor BamE [Enterobacteriaceae bacterium]